MTSNTENINAVPYRTGLSIMMESVLLYSSIPRTIIQRETEIKTTMPTTWGFDIQLVFSPPRCSISFQRVTTTVNTVAPISIPVPPVNPLAYGISMKASAPPNDWSILFFSESTPVNSMNAAAQKTAK